MATTIAITAPINNVPQNKGTAPSFSPISGVTGAKEPGPVGREPGHAEYAEAHEAQAEDQEFAFHRVERKLDPVGGWGNAATSPTFPA